MFEFESKGLFRFPNNHNLFVNTTNNFKVNKKDTNLACYPVYSSSSPAADVSIPFSTSNSSVPDISIHSDSISSININDINTSFTVSVSVSVLTFIVLKLFCFHFYWLRMPYISYLRTVYLKTVVLWFFCSTSLCV